MSTSTQPGKILALLTAAKGREVSAVELSKISLQYSARINELRKQGLRIENRVERVGRTKHGYFRLAIGPVSAPQATPCRFINNENLTLFAQDARHFDDN